MTGVTRELPSGEDAPGGILVISRTFEWWRGEGVPSASLSEMPHILVNPSDCKYHTGIRHNSWTQYCLLLLPLLPVLKSSCPPMKTH